VTEHFRPQIDGDPVRDGVCGLLIAEKLGVSQPTASEQWISYRRDKRAITAFKALLRTEI